jgi:hypothetical protein
LCPWLRTRFDFSPNIRARHTRVLNVIDQKLKDVYVWIPGETVSLLNK